jgi:hypothetical protein
MGNEREREREREREIVSIIFSVVIKISNGEYTELE